MNRLAAGVVALALGALGGTARAADHRDGPGTLTDASVDITDVYAWMSADGAKVYLIMNLQGSNTGAVAGMTKFSSTALYAFHVSSGAKYGDPNAKQDLIVCKFSADASQTFQCWAPMNEYVTGAVGDKAGSVSMSGKVKAAALVRDDAFWFNIRGFLRVASTVKAVAGNLMFDGAGCPKLDAPTSMLLVNTLKGDGANGPGTDDFGKMGAAPVACTQMKCDATAKTNGNVLSIVLAIDKSVLTAGGPIVSVWGSTNLPK